MAQAEAAMARAAEAELVEEGEEARQVYAMQRHLNRALVLFATNDQQGGLHSMCQAV